MSDARPITEDNYGNWGSGWRDNLYRAALEELLKPLF